METSHTPSAPANPFGIRQAPAIGVGLLTSIVLLASAHGLRAATDLNVLGWFLYSIPVGAAAIGLIAGVGYGYGTRWIGFRLNKQFALAILPLSIISYLTVDYADFRLRGPFAERSTGAIVSYWEYFHAEASSWGIESEYGLPTAQIGVLGYYFTLAAMAGFAGSSLIVPAIMSRAPYCTQCAAYLSERRLALWRESIRPALGLVTARDHAGFDVVQIDGYESVDQRMESLLACAQAADVERFRLLSTQTSKSKKEAGRQLVRHELKLWSCRNCGSGYLENVRVSGRAWQVKRRRQSKVDLPSGFARSLRGR